MKFCVILVALLQSILLSQCNKSKIVLAIETFRHGARGLPEQYEYFPVWDFNSEYNKFWREELTKAGQKQHFELGKKLRKKYIEDYKLLSEEFNHKEIHVQSSDMNRTLMSAAQHMRGLYPDDVVPIHTKFILDDELFFPLLPPLCPNSSSYQSQYYDQNYERINKLILAHYNDTFNFLSEKLNRTVDLFTIEVVWDIFISDKHNGQKLPEWMDDQRWKELQEIDTLWWNFIPYGGETLARLYNRNAFRDWLVRLEDKVKNPESDFKMLFHSSHDGNLNEMLNGLNLTSFECAYDLYVYGQTEADNCVHRPWFASSLILELHQREDNSFFVKMSYEDEYVNLLGQGKECDYEIFKDFMQSYIYSDEDYKNLCFNQVKKEQQQQQKDL